MYKGILNSKGMKATPKRVALLTFLEEENKYFSPQEIFEKIKIEFEKIGISTIYRILHEFVRTKLVSIYYHKESNEMKYFSCLRRDHHHHHFICTKCKKIECIEFCNSAVLQKEVQNQIHGFMTNHILQLEGVCQQCLNKKEANVSKKRSV